MLLNKGHYLFVWITHVEVSKSGEVTLKATFPTSSTPTAFNVTDS